MRRGWALALSLSLVAHVALVGGALLVAFLRGWPTIGSVNVEITGMSLDEIKDLPLGPPPGGAEAAEDKPRPRVRRAAPATPEAEGSLSSREDKSEEQAGAREATADTGAATRPSDLRSYGPEGSRLTVLLRLDRLRKTPYATGVDALLSGLPDRRDLLEGTGLNLYGDFDALLIATPNPLDYTVTFLAARHRLKEPDLRAALDRGAEATGRVLEWHTESRRPVAERRSRRPQAAGPTRDNRLLVLPAPGLVVVTPPVYRRLLLGTAKPRSAAGADAGLADAGAAAGTAAGATDREGIQPPAGAEGWNTLLRRIDAEDSVMPEDGIAMLTAVDIFSARSLRRGLDMVPPARGYADDAPGRPTILGMELPRMITLLIGAEPTPFVNITAEFKTEAQAVQWEKEWPALHAKLRTNPYLVLTGFSALLNRTRLEREGVTVRIRQTATELETTRLLQLLARYVASR
jgi:hypothetical protein